MALAIILVVVVGILAFFAYKVYAGSGPQIEGVESMPPEVRKAYTGQGGKTP